MADQLRETLSLAPIDVHLRVDNERAVISVRNHGKPIPPGEFEAIFQQFVRSRDAAEPATGSALVFSDADTGTVFVIDVPVDARPDQDN